MAKIIKRPWHLYQPRFLPYDWMPPIPRPLTTDEYIEQEIFRSMEGEGSSDDFDPSEAAELYEDYIEFNGWREIVEPILQEALVSLPMSLRLRVVGMAFKMVEDVWSVSPLDVERAILEWNQWRQWWFSVNRFVQGLDDTIPLPVPIPATGVVPDSPVVTDAQRNTLVAAENIMLYLEQDPNLAVPYLTRVMELLAYVDGLYDLDVTGYDPGVDEALLYDQMMPYEVRFYDQMMREWRFYNEWAGKVQGLLAFRISESD